jgi:catechol 2,3-dioxygenase-like lactoylglutathione lyase family enzyme
MRQEPRRVGVSIVACLASVLVFAQTANRQRSIVTIDRMDHVGINVTNLQRSADWYQRVLGFTIFHKWQTTWMIARGDMHIGLFLRPKAFKINDIDNTLAITHFAFDTDEKGFEQAQATLRQLGIKFDPPEDTGVAHSLFIYDPDGYQVEITSYYK